ncbi:uncharacterized protein SCHCODRAFT_02638565 [Schizophyllum commune H4-8]|uniref:uncharacterized protein n=1 Tax=Schizophyllum commune (strain H4-8 / FGSC 9210) TaxID=578458 RepID=UPI00215ECE26|nr:uncharacterized protein SCHCODRAFT_02638565 [Schizophyllum commune H4-8]KAI5887634.1 hypothetical protein SCHCODRAFT_02638565 [Schizophyllum commune H4-8]
MQGGGRGRGGPSQNLHPSHHRQQVATPTNDDRHPIHCLPNEVLEIIFLFSIPDELANPTPGSHVAYYAYLDRCKSIDYPHFLGRVCRRWRVAAQGCPMLWSYICVDIGARKPYNASYYTSVLAKSSENPLTLSFVVGKNQLLNTVLHGPVFSPHIRRVRMLCIQLSSYFLSADAPRVDILPLFPTVDTPLLESLRLDCRKAPWSVIRYLEKLQRGGEPIPDHLRFFRHAPRLEEFALEGLDSPDATHEAMECMSLRRMGLAGFEWQNMTRLRLPDVPRRVFDLLRVLGDAKRLVELRCTIFEDLEDEFSYEGHDEYIIDTEDEMEDEDWDEEEEEDEEDEEEEEEEEESDDDYPHAYTRFAARTRVQQNPRAPTNNATSRALADARRADRECRQRELAARHAEREVAREKKRRDNARLLGPHVFPDLTKLHLVLMAFEPENYGEYDDENPEERSGVERFLGALVMPALASLTIAHRGEEFEGGGYSDGEGYGYGYGGGGGGGGGEPKVYPHLKAFVQRSECVVLTLTLDSLAIEQSELLDILKLFPHVRTLRLVDATKAMSAGFWQALGRRERDGRLALMPDLHHLVVHQDRGRTGRGGFINVNVLDAVEARWKAGMGGGARVEVVHCPTPTKGRKGKPAQVLDSQMRGRLRRVQGRADLELMLTELPFKKKPLRQVGGSDYGESEEGHSDEVDYDDEFEYY